MNAPTRPSVTPHAAVGFGSMRWEVLRYLPIGPWAITLGALIFVLNEFDQRPRGQLAAWLCLGIGVVLVVVGLVRAAVARGPAIVAAPEGLLIRTLSKQTIPWSGILAIEDTPRAAIVRIDSATMERIGTATLAYWQGRRQYAAVSPDLKLPWRWMGAAREDVLAEFVARWQAFRDRPADPRGAAPIDPTRVAGMGPAVVARGGAATGPRLAGGTIAWMAATNALPLVVLAVVGANALGLWATETQLAKRARNQEFAEIFARNKADSDRIAAESRRVSESFDRTFRCWEMHDKRRAAGIAGPVPGCEGTSHAVVLPQAVGAPPPAERPRPETPAAPTVGHRDVVLGLAPVSNGAGFISVGGDNAIFLWELSRPGVALENGRHAGIVRGVVALPDGIRFLTAGDDGEVVLRARRHAQPLATLKLREHGRANALALSRDGRRVVSVHEKGAVVVIGTESRAVLEVGNVGGMAQRAVALTDDGRLAVTGGVDGAISVWDTGSGKLVRRFGDHRGPVYDIVLTADGRHALSGGGDSLVILWDIETGERVRAFEGHVNTVYAVALSPDGATLLTGSLDGTARLWEIATGRQRARIEHGASVYAVAFMPDGRPLTGGRDGVIRLWKPEGGEAEAVFPGK